MSSCHSQEALHAPGTGVSPAESPWECPKLMASKVLRNYLKSSSASTPRSRCLRRCCARVASLTLASVCPSKSLKNLPLCLIIFILIYQFSFVKMSFESYFSHSKEIWCLQMFCSFIFLLPVCLLKMGGAVGRIWEEIRVGKPCSEYIVWKINKILFNNKRLSPTVLQSNLMFSLIIYENIDNLRWKL